MREMDEYIDEILRAVNGGLYSLAVVGALTIPDICGALGYPNGRADGRRYRHWWDENLPEYADHMPGDRAYAFRNSLLHQGSAVHERREGDRIILMEPRSDGSIVHRGTHVISATEVAHIMFIPMLVSDIVTAARTWLNAHAHDPIVAKNLGRFVRRREHGYSGVIVGAAVIT